MPLTRPQIRAIAYKSGKVPGLGMVLSATAFATTTVTVTGLGNTNQAAAHYEQAAIYRPNSATAATTGVDLLRFGTTIATNVLSHGGENYSDTTAGPEVIEIVGRDLLGNKLPGFLPEEINDCIRRGLRRVYFETWEALSIFPDGAFGLSGVTNWTGGNGATPTKITTEGFGGIQALNLANSGTFGYAVSDVINVNPGDTLVCGAIGRLVSGGTVGTDYVYITLQDVTHTATIGVNAVSYGLNYNRMIKVDTIPSGCFQVRIYLTSSGTAAVSRWATTFGHLLSDQILRDSQIPSWLAEPFQLLEVAEARYGGLQQEAQAASVGQVHPANSMSREAWRNPDDFQLLPEVEGPSPRSIQFHRPLPQTDLWVHGKRQYSDIVALDDETDSTDAPEDMLMAAVYAELGALLAAKYNEKGENAKRDYWKLFQAEHERTLMAQRQARKQALPHEETRVRVIGGRAGGW